MTSHRQNRMEKKSMGKNMFRVVMCTSLVLAAMYSLRAQTVSGTILGLIQDQQGAVVAKTEVTARNLETGAVRKTTADDNGAYRIFSIPAGPYEVSASAAGFKTEVRTGIAVTVGSDISVNFSLTVGAISEQVQAGRLREFDHHPRAPVERPRLAPTDVVAAGSPAKCGRISGRYFPCPTRQWSGHLHFRRPHR